MKISIVTLGTCGDVQPYVAPGQGLQRAGHQVQIVTLANFAPLVQEYGLPFAPLTGDAQELMRQLIHVGTRNLRFLAGRFEPTRGGRPISMLYAFSSHMVPQPADWGTPIHICGYWVLNQPQSWQPPAALRDFLAAGPPPVYVGFGNMAGTDFDRLTRIVIQAQRISGQRVILQRGWGGLSGRDDINDMLVIDAVPHDWLFPQMAAVVHHGGAGTTAAGLHAGVPSIIVPFGFDQPFWGARLQHLGVSPATLSYHTLTAKGLAQAIRRTVGDPQIRAQARRVGECVRAEDGVGRAVAIIEAATA